MSLSHSRKDYWLGEDQYEKESGRHDDKNHPIGEVQDICELHQCSPKIRWRMDSWERTM